ncbi:uncharacterized protein METZ01_LOCUS455689, partial [marine metagenome]
VAVNTIKLENAAIGALFLFVAALQVS